MTTEFVSTIRASGGDYSSLSAWITDYCGITNANGFTGSGDLVGNDVIAVAEVYNDWPSGIEEAVQVSGSFTTDATRYIVIRPASGQGHDGTPGTGFYINWTAGTGTPLSIQVPYTRVIGIESRYTGSGSASAIYLGQHGVIDKCIATTVDGDGIKVSGTAGKIQVVKNCLAYGCSGSGVLSDSLAATRYIYNCTSVNNDYGFRVLKNNGSQHIKNCLAYNNTTADFNFAGTSIDDDYNASSDATATGGGGANSLNSQTFTFVDAANDDYHLASGDTGARGNGTNLSAATEGFTDDVDGDTRSAWDIGFDEFVGGGAGNPTGTGSITAHDAVISASGSLGATPPASNGAISFDKVDDYYRIEDSADLTFPNSDWFVGIFIRATELAGTSTRYIWDMGGGGGFNSASLRVQEASASVNPGAITFAARGGSSTGVQLVSADNSLPTDGSEFLLLAQRTGGLVKLWKCVIGGTATLLASQSDSTMSEVNSSNGIEINRKRAQATGNYFGNVLGHFFKGDYALTQTQIESIAAQGPTYAPQDLVVYIPMTAADATIADAANAGVASDTATRNGNPATTTGFTFSGAPTTISGTGSITGHSATISASSSTRGVGDFTGNSGTFSCTGEVIIEGSGGTIGPIGTFSATGGAPNPAMVGGLVAEDATISASGSLGSIAARTGTGSITANSSDIAGSGNPVAQAITGTGAITANEPALAGFSVDIYSTDVMGNVVAEQGTFSGTGTVVGSPTTWAEVVEANTTWTSV